MTTATTNASYKINDAMKARVLETLDRMRTIASADMMQQVGYISDDIVKPRRVRAICGGRQACAIGSLWLAAGVRPRQHPGFTELPGASQGPRGDFIRNKPVLRHALHFLNEAACEYMDEHGIRPHPSMWRDSIEALFESEDSKLRGYQGQRRLAMLKVISSAKRKVKAA